MEKEKDELINNDEKVREFITRVVRERENLLESVCLFALIELFSPTAS